MALRVIASCVLLFLLNAAVCRELFQTEYTRHMGSIEAAYIGLSRVMLTHLQWSNWFPLWYCGIPSQNTYPPLLHLLVTANAWIFGISTALSHHAVTAATYCLGPVALFLLAYAMSGSWNVSFAAGMMFSLVSPSAFLMPSVYQDLHSLRLPRRLQTLVTYGDGPHITSVTLLFLAIAAFHLAMEKRTPLRVAIAAVAFAAVAATNWLGTFALALACVSYLAARSFDNPRFLRMLSLSVLIAALGYAMIAPWIPPSTIGAVRKNAQVVGGAYSMGSKQTVYAILLLSAFFSLRWALRRSGTPLLLRFALFFLLLTAGIALPADWFHVYLMPQPERYHLEMEAAIVLVLAFGLQYVLRRMTTSFQVCLLVGLAALCVSQFIQFRRFARNTLAPIDIRQTVEYQASTWLGRNLPGERVFATGSLQYWLNAFSDNPEVGGGDDQGIVDSEVPVMTFGIPYTSGDGPQMEMLLRILGVHAIVVSERTGRDAYKQIWHDPLKFHSVLPELWRNGGDVIYGVPQRSKSLAHVIRAGDILWHAPINVIDLQGVHRLNTALENASLPTAAFEWKSDTHARISGILSPADVLFVQISFHPGWHASSNSQPLPIRRDGLGFMILEPRCTGKCEVELVYDGGIEMKIAKTASICAILALFILAGVCVIHLRKTESASNRRSLRSRDQPHRT